MRVALLNSVTAPLGPSLQDFLPAAAHLLHHQFLGGVCQKSVAALVFDNLQHPRDTGLELRILL